MKLKDKNTGKFIGVALIGGMLTFAIACGLWYMVSGVNWLDFLGIPITIISCWIIGALTAWLVIPERKDYLLGIAAYLFTIGVNFIIAAFNFLNGEPSINGWIVLFAIGFAIISIPGAILLNLVTIRILK
ncbi:hypothetical protein [Bacteroides acidifaciens]|uniref:hypothetical protein n=1 Tax=Bacteroides acidifaciens TaxID=85831 RepID=UPI0025B3FD1C|nr:hypothetical protein [Bacteroides acidifaciens]